MTLLWDLTNTVRRALNFRSKIQVKCVIKAYIHLIIPEEIEILYSVENFSCTVVIAETGSGKTTRKPALLHLL